MIGIAPLDLLRNRIAKALALQSAGHFSRYSSTVLSEVLRKGYIGSTRPDDALRLARQKAAAGTAIRMPTVIDRLRSDFGIVGIAETQRTLSAVLEEASPLAYCPPRELRDPPGYPFIFESKCLRGPVYLKFQIVGSVRNPRVVLWSCHKPDFGWKGN